MADEGILLRKLPNNLEAEQAVLGSMLIDPRCVAEVVGFLKGEDFYEPVNRDIFETVSSMFNYSRSIDAVTVLNELRQKEGREDLRDYLARLMEITPTAANVMEYAGIIRDKSLLRAVAETGMDLNTMAMEAAAEANAVLDAAEQKVYNIRQGRNVGGLEPISKTMVGVYSNLVESAKGGAKLPGVATGLVDLDNMIMGLNNSDLIIICARPGMGKTTIALNIALSVAKHTDKAVAVFSLEMSREQLCMRLLSAESNVSNKKLHTGDLNAEEWGKIAYASSTIGGTQLLLDDNPALTVSEMKAACRRVRNLGLVVIDYLQLMTSAGTDSRSYSNENRTQVVSDISRMLKIMAKELNVPVICAAQLSRASESRQNKRPMLSDLRESGAIEQDADIVMGLYRDDYYNDSAEQPNIAECIILKNRRGETGTVELQWVPEYSSFTGVDYKHDR